MMEEEHISCPFACGFEARGVSVEYQIMLHMETKHSENGSSPFVATEDASTAALAPLDKEEPVEYLECPVEGCGETILLTELDDHVEMHEAEHQPTGDEAERSLTLLEPDANLNTASNSTMTHYPRDVDIQKDSDMEATRTSHDKQSTAKAIWKSILKMPDERTTSKLSNSAAAAKAGRRKLGKSELGPYAMEKQMPAWLTKLLQEEDGASRTVKTSDRGGRTKRVKIYPNMVSGVIPVLEQLLQQDKTVAYAYLCHPAVRHVSKLKREGGFCGYRNIQMVSSFIIDAESQGYERFEGKVPTIFDIQDYIENAWDLGINAQGRVETGGIRGTRKYIGTPDAQAMFCRLGIACDAQGIRPKGTSKPAYELLFKVVEDYFVQGCLDISPNVRCTSLPPIYFQHSGHSMTIVGFESKADETKNLIVFDPMFHDSPDITKVIGRSFQNGAPQHLLKAYRRGIRYLRKYNEFELLKLTPPPKTPVFTND